MAPSAALRPFSARPSPARAGCDASTCQTANYPPIGSSFIRRRSCLTRGRSTAHATANCPLTLRARPAGTQGTGADRTKAPPYGLHIMCRLGSPSRKASTGQPRNRPTSPMLNRRQGSRFAGSVIRMARGMSETPQRLTFCPFPPPWCYSDALRTGFLYSVAPLGRVPQCGAHAFKFTYTRRENGIRRKSDRQSLLGYR
ncbi:hypothetical protein Y026_6101 [Burkholderia pseudomallei TSV28]|nr:hypothetical protein Y026_6101 [Burkholderia pseudomallei TSV28]